jgi:hypothetical protein
MTATDFTPVASLLGGALIGASAVMLMAALGRIPFILGIVAAPLVVLLATGTAPLPGIEAGPALLAFAGLLVGMAGARWLADRPATIAPANQRG